jgi:hypothetical protein
MARSSFPARRALLACLVVAPAAAFLFAACGNTQSTAPPPPPSGFGDGGGTPPHHDATVPPKKDSGGGMDAPTSMGSDALLGAETPCTNANQCASGVCEPINLENTTDGAVVHYDAGACDTPGRCECQAATCTDGVKNGHETDVDCGGGSCPKCPYKSTCATGSDCQQGECGTGYAGAKCTGTVPDGGADAAVDTCICEAPTCGDGVQNEDETDIDCGGSLCNACPTGKNCKDMGDCTSDVCTANLCACPAGMTEAPTSSSVPYCIDTYEVTYKQYSMFIGSANANTLATQPAECSWNKTFVPSDNWPQVGDEAMNPVDFVNWCDAFAYCASVEKHLCGAIADPTTGQPGGAPVPLTGMAEFHDASVLAANDPAIDEWFNACSSQGTDAYPYGNTYQGQWCNGVDSPAQLTSGPVELPPGSLNYVLATGAASCVLDTACGVGQAGVLSTVAQTQIVSCDLLGPGATIPSCGPAFMEAGCIGGSSTNVIFDLSGNVAEWENSCSASTGATDECAVRGGAYDTKPGMTTLTCASSSAQPPVPRQTQAADIGFRCCL